MNTDDFANPIRGRLGRVDALRGAEHVVCHLGIALASQSWRKQCHPRWPRAHPRSVEDYLLFPWPVGLGFSSLAEVVRLVRLAEDGETMIRRLEMYIPGLVGKARNEYLMIKDGRVPPSRVYAERRYREMLEDAEFDNVS